ncbi:MAG TPA: hypothetical protein DCG30_02245 [Ruminococcus sp.]|nr:hypothetical protein [Ruminococcus sp.]
MIKKIMAAAAALSIMFGAGYMMRDSQLPEIHSSDKSIVIEVDAGAKNNNNAEQGTFNKKGTKGITLENLPMRTEKSGKAEIHQLPVIKSDAKGVFAGRANSSDFHVCLL